MFHLPGQGGPGGGGAGDGQRIYSSADLRRGGDRPVPDLQTAHPLPVWGQRRHLSLCRRLYDRLSSGDGIRDDRVGHEPVHQRPGLRPGGDDDGGAWGGGEHRAGPHFHLLAGPGGAGGGLGHRDRSGLLRRVGAGLSHRAEGGPPPAAQVHGAEACPGAEDRLPGPIRLFYEPDQQPGPGGVQRHPPGLRRRPVCGRDDHYQLPAGGVYDAHSRAVQRGPAGDGL